MKSCRFGNFFLGIGFREDEVAHACDTDVDFKMKTISVLEKRQWNWKPKDKEERTVPVPDAFFSVSAVFGGEGINHALHRSKIRHGVR